jgi:hypothetical protein
VNGLRPSAQLPEPARFWIRFAPRSWPAPAGLRLDLARAGLAPGIPRLAGAGGSGEARQDGLGNGAGIAALTSFKLQGIAGPLDDLLYLPAVPAVAAAARDRLARSHLAVGTPVLVQLTPGEETGLGSGGEGSGATPIYDLLETLIEGDLERLGSLPAGAAAVWPLVPGFTDDPGLWVEGCERLGAAGPRVVQAVALQLDPADRRRLAERGGEAAFDALFHRVEEQGEGPGDSQVEGLTEVPSSAVERAFARVAHSYGLAPFLPRPLPGPQVHGRENRQLAGLLALAAELWLRLGRPAGQGQALYGAARQADRTQYDLRALAREGNLAVLGWLEALGRAAVEEWARAGSVPLLEELLAEYLAAAPA